MQCTLLEYYMCPMPPCVCVCLRTRLCNVIWVHSAVHMNEQIQTSNGIDTFHSQRKMNNTWHAKPHTQADVNVSGIFDIFELMIFRYWFIDSRADWCNLFDRENVVVKIENTQRWIPSNGIFAVPRIPKHCVQLFFWSSFGYPIPINRP